MRKAALAGESLESLRSRLQELRPLIALAVEFADEWDEVYRPLVLKTALNQLRGSFAHSVSGSGSVVHPAEPERPTQLVAEAPMSRLARSVNVDADLLRRVIHFEEDGGVQILGRIHGSITSELQNKYAAVYAFIREKSQDAMNVGIDELRELCKQHGCYDSSNFTRYFRSDSRLRELKGAKGRDKRYVATKKGLEDAVALIREMAEG